MGRFKSIIFYNELRLVVSIILLLAFGFSQHALSASNIMEQYFIFQKNNKKGVRNADDEIIIPAQYDDLGWSIGEFHPVGDILGYKENGLWGLMTLENEQIGPPEYQNLYPLNRQLVAASKLENTQHIERYGIIDLQGNTVLDFEFGWLSMFNNHIIASKSLENTWIYGMINLSFQEVVPFKYTKIKPLNNQFAIITEGNKSGLINASGEVVAAPKYHQIELQGNRFRGKLFDTYEIRNEQNQLLASEQLQSLESATDGVLLARGGYSNRLIASDGKVITNHENTEFLDFTDTWAVIKRNELYGLVDLTGKELLSPKYKLIWVIENFAGLQHSSGEWKLLNTELQEVTKRDYQQIDPVTEGLFPMMRQNSWGFIDQTGIEVIPPQYQEVGTFNDGQAFAKYLGSWGVIDANGNWLIKPRYDKLEKVNNQIYLFEEGSGNGIVSTKQFEVYKTENKLKSTATGIIEVGEDGKLGLVSFGGIPVLSVHYTTISPFREDPRYFTFEDDEGFGIYNIEQQKFFRDTTIQEIRTLDEGYIGVRINDQYGLIDLNGKLRIANRYEDVGVFNEDMLPVKIRGKWGYVDRLERLKIQPTYHTAGHFVNELAIVSRDNKYGLVSKSGEVVLSLEYDKIVRLQDGQYIFHQQHQAGLVSSEGRVLLYPRYETLETMENGHLKISKNGKLGVISKQGKTLIPPVNDEVLYDQVNQVYLLTKKYPWDEIKL